MLFHAELELPQTRTHCRQTLVRTKNSFRNCVDCTKICRTISVLMTVTILVPQAYTAKPLHTSEQIYE